MRVDLKDRFRVRNVVRRVCFRILFLSCVVWSADVHGRMPLSRAVVTRLVTHLVSSHPSRSLVHAGCTARQRYVK